jgi:hypothetical protein
MEVAFVGRVLALAAKIETFPTPGVNCQEGFCIWVGELAR